MDELIIKLNNDYEIEIDRLNYTLKKRYINKKGNPDVRVCGYFGNIRQCMMKYLEECQIDNKSTEGMTMLEYVKMVEQSNLNAISALYGVLDGFPVK